MSDSFANRRKCLNYPDSFCYICGSFTIPRQRTEIRTFVKEAYYDYFMIKVDDQDKSWAPLKVCRQCMESLRMWTKGKREKMPFGIPMIWREPNDHLTDYYFCIVKTTGYNSKNKSKMEYLSLSSAMRPQSH